MRRERRLQPHPDTPWCSAPFHGTRNAYQRVECRCPDAREDWRLYKKRRREHRQPAGYAPVTRACRRLRALAALGWTAGDIAAAAGMSGATVHDLMRPCWETITVENDRQVRAVYDRLCGTPGPSQRAATRAATKGWPPPLAWDDIDDLDERPVREGWRPAGLPRRWAPPAGQQRRAS